MRLSSVLIFSVCLNSFFCYGSTIDISAIKNALTFCNGDIKGERGLNVIETVQHFYNDKGFLFYENVWFGLETGSILSVNREVSRPQDITRLIVKQSTNNYFYDVIAQCKSTSCMKGGYDFNRINGHTQHEDIGPYRADNVHVASCITKDRANMTAEMLSKALHVKFSK